MNADFGLDVPNTERGRDRLCRQKAFPPRVLAAFLFSLLSLASAGCLQLIAPYDDQTVRDIFAAARAVDQFYGELLEAPAGKRQYALFSERYVRIESDLRALVLRNEVRPLNEDSTEIARNSWRRFKKRSCFVSLSFMPGLYHEGPSIRISRRRSGRVWRRGSPDKCQRTDRSASKRQWR